MHFVLGLLKGDCRVLLYPYFLAMHSVLNRLPWAKKEWARQQQRALKTRSDSCNNPKSAARGITATWNGITSACDLSVL